MTIEKALADLAAATSSGVLGRPVDIDGFAVDAVKTGLNQEEAQAFAGGHFGADGLLIEGIRLTVDRNKLSWQPVVGGRMKIDGADYDIRQVGEIGILLRITLTRFIS
ncbi:MAG: hypothetical protein VR65_10810 [Desulfobulbaceae bacterium BRH_c16a]|nr:MAG: hypothetical protein VR65_10810 [Desulfobulbaceae bacterium BRH_c16a]